MFLAHSYAAARCTATAARAELHCSKNSSDRSEDIENSEDSASSESSSSNNRVEDNESCRCNSSVL